MKKTYLIEKDLGREWLGTGKLVLLLDGLDEVTALGARHSCHNAIQELIKRRHCGLSVSSRTEEYLTLNPLQLNFAVEVLPAKESQVLQYIATIPSAHRLGLALKKDPNAITVLTTPFALTLALVAYSKKSKLQPSAGSFSIFRLLDDFVNTQISIKLKRNEYKREDFLRWMRNLAQCSKTGKQAVFDPLELRERWLATAWQHAACKLATILAVAAFCFLVEEALWTGYYTGIARCWNGPLTVPCWELALEQRDFSILKTFPGDFLWSAIQAGIAACVIGVPVGVFGPLFRLRPVQFAPTVLFPGRIRQALQAFIVAFAGISGVSTLMGLILRRLYQINILPERSNWASPLGQLKGPMHAAVGYAVGRTLTVTASALVGLFIASLLAFTAFLSFDTNSNRTLPSAIKTTISIALVLGVSTGTFLWLFVPSAVIQNMTRLGSDLIEKPDIPFGGALLVVLAAGGLFTIRFYITRLMMVVTRNGPWNYGRFLDLATECWFLCPVSGSDRIFRHPMLRNYFADPTMGGHPR